MKKRNIFSITILFIIVFTLVSTVSANDNILSNDLNISDEISDTPIANYKTIDSQSKDIDTTENLKESVTLTTSSSIYVGLEGRDSNKGTKISPVNSLKAAILKVSNGGTIYISSGVYFGEKNRNLTIDKNLTIKGVGDDVTINGENINRILTTTQGTKVTIISLIFTQGGNITKGGAILANGDLVLKNTTFTDNKVTTEAGALLAYGNLKVDNCTFFNNAVLDDGITSPGGAISTNGNSTITNTKFDKNSAGCVAGVINRGNCYINNCSFTRGFAGYCGGAVSNRGTLVVNNSYFGHNYATFYAGVVLSPRGSQSIKFYNSIMEYNGAGLFSSVLNSYTSNVWFEECSFYGNYIKGNNKTEGKYDPDKNKGELLSDGDINATFNWWGSNNLSPTYQVKNCTGYINASTWLVMNLKANETLKTGKTSYLIVDLKHYFDNDTQTIKTLKNDISLALKVKFYTNKGTIKTVTLKNGIAKIQYTPGKDVTTVYAKIDNQTLKIPVVQRNYTKLNANALTLTDKKAKSYQVTLKDDKGKLLANKKVSIKVNGKTYSKLTNSKGVAKIILNISKAGTYKIKTSFAGDDKYVQSTVTKKAIVKSTRQKTKIIAPRITVKPNTVKYLKVALKDTKNKAVKNKNLKITIKGKTYTVKTNSKGIGQLKVTKKSKKAVLVKVKFLGDKNYYPSAKNTYLK